MSNTPVDKQQEKRDELRRAALEYHEFPTPGKVAIAATKQLVNQRDLALAGRCRPAARLCAGGCANSAKDGAVQTAGGLTLTR